jgi:magnesium-dependent phosphatase 1
MSNNIKLDFNTAALHPSFRDNENTKHYILSNCSIKIIKDFEEDNNLIEERIINEWNKLKHKPKCIVFDLDLTLWPFWIDSHVEFPFHKKVVNGKLDIIDRDGQYMTQYSQVTRILHTLRHYCLKKDGFMAIASRTSLRNEAIELLKLYNWFEYFDAYEMHSGSKCVHISEITNKLKITNKSQILFFDDDPRNIYDTQRLGLTGYELDERLGLIVEDVIKGFQKFEEKYGNLLSYQDKTNNIK